ncbi:restriction endonuclease subunit S [Hymenobacter sp. 5414T-23]|uniref:restriction endonuclease subunit S n=1 Tax=Hymenobacter sp. 5414T-23 TaxID=2932252 RepID=UPI001FD508C7|nr:restriction endonuclease subunit S [Hymenobacter sp. 5414T-23]UOQ80995.1 restriction endonuclease subunit S [Hymenobacter sp. 5414T-23]
MNWRSIRIGDFLHRVRIPVDIKDDQDYNLVTIRMHHKGVALRGIKRGKDIGSKRMYRVAPGHFILSGIDARHGAFGIVPEELDGAVVTNDFWYFEVDEEQVDKELFLHLTSTSFFDDLCRIASDGTTNRVRLQADKFFNYEINLPAVEDQRELMAQLKHTNAAVAAVLEETDQQLAHLTQLRQALLREAMQGQLLPQDPTDEPAAVLLQKLQVAKAAAGKGGKCKAGTLFAEEPVDGPFEIPSSWEWITLGEIASKIGSGSTPKAGYTKEGVPFFRSQNIYEEGLELSDVVYISQDIHHSMRGTQVQENDVLLNITGGSLGRATLVTDLPSGGNVSQHVCIVRSSTLNSRFLHKLILSPYFQDLIFTSTSGAGRQGLPKYNLEQFLIPIPPLAEQHRIVVKLEQLMQHCDALEQRIRESRRLAEQLLQTALREALAPPAGTEPAEETELELAEIKLVSPAPRRGRPLKKRLATNDPDLFSELADLFGVE